MATIPKIEYTHAMVNTEQRERERGEKKNLHEKKNGKLNLAPKTVHLTH